MATGDFNRYAEWLRKRGPTLTAHELGVTRSAVWAWIYNEVQPRPEMAHKIVELGKGEITLEDVYAGNPKARIECRKP